MIQPNTRVPRGFPGLRAFPRGAIRLVALAFGLLLAGCVRRESPVEAGIRDQVLHLGNGAEPQDLDPQIVAAYTDYNILIALFEGLTAIDEQTSQGVPAAAERWDVSPDGLNYTFYLRRNGRWSNGDPVTARDFVYSIHRMLSPALAAEYAYVLWPLKNAKAFNTGKLTDFSAVGAEALDDHTLRLTLARPTPYFITLVAHQAWLPVPRGVIEKFGPMDQRGTAWTRPANLVGNGPFVLKEWSPDKRVVVARNPHYWDAAAVRLNEMIFHPIDNVDAEERNFRAGQLHITYEMPLSKIDAYRRDQPEVLRTDPFLETFFLRFNVTRPPLNDRRVRQALARAIDREAIVRRITRGGQTPAHSFTPPGTAGYTARARIPTDFAAARHLLDEAGYPAGRGFPVIDIQMNISEINRKIFEAIQEMWKRELGITATLSNQDFRVYLDNQRTLNYAISRARWVADYADPNTFLDMFVTNGGQNWTGWGDPEYDRLIAEAGHTLDPAKRHEIFQRAEALLLEEAPIAPVFFGTRIYLCHPSVKNWHPALLGIHQYKYVYLDDL